MLGEGEPLPETVYIDAEMREGSLFPLGITGWVAVYLKYSVA